MSTTTNTTAGFYLQTEDDAGVVRRIAEWAVVDAAEILVCGDGCPGQTELADTRLSLKSLANLHAALCAFEALVPASEAGCQAHWLPLDERMVAVLRKCADFLIGMHKDTLDDPDTPNRRWDSARADIARRAMFAVDRSALMHDLAQEQDPEVRDALANELGALELERAGEREGDGDDGDN